MFKKSSSLSAVHYSGDIKYYENNSFEFWFMLYANYALMKRLHINANIHYYPQLPQSKGYLKTLELVIYSTSDSKI